jgi:hypothetical protein
MLTQWPVLIIVGSTMTLVYPLWYLLQRRLLHRSSGEAALQALTVSLPNVAAVGLPVASALLGPDRSPYQDQRTYGRAPIRLLRHLARIELWLVSEETGSLMISSTVGSTLTLHCRCGIYPRVMRAFRALVSR